VRATRSAPNLSAVFNTPLCINRLVTDWICAGSGNSAAAVAVAATSFYGRFACRTRDACEGLLFQLERPREIARVNKFSRPAYLEGIAPKPLTRWHIRKAKANFRRAE